MIREIADFFFGGNLLSVRGSYLAPMLTAGGLGLMLLAYGARGEAFFYTSWFQAILESPDFDGHC
jgi:hypothetical protein